MARITLVFGFEPLRREEREGVFYCLFLIGTPVKYAPVRFFEPQSREGR